jgi:hypothetical protein
MACDRSSVEYGMGDLKHLFYSMMHKEACCEHRGVQLVSRILMGECHKLPCGALKNEWSKLL